MPKGRISKNPIEINSKFGRLTIIAKRKEARLGNPDQLVCDCLCDCGNKVTYRHEYLNAFKNTRIFSCGCYNNMEKKGNTSKNWRGIEELSGSYFAAIKSGARMRKIEFHITIQDAWDQFVKQDKKCSLSNIPLVLLESKRKENIEQTASLDRIDSTKPYTKDNIQWVHKDINRMKNNYQEIDFLNYIKLIYEFKDLGHQIK